MNRKINYSPSPMSLQFNQQHPLTQSALQNNIINNNNNNNTLNNNQNHINLVNNRQLGYNSPMQPYPLNYHNKTINQQQKQLMNNQQQLLNFGSRNYKVPHHGNNNNNNNNTINNSINNNNNHDQFDFQNDYNNNQSAKYKNKSKTSLDQYNNSQLTPKQISLLDKIENIKKKGAYTDEKQSKFPPLQQLQFPNLASYADEKPQSEGNKPMNSNSQQNGLINPSFNQKNNMVNTFNGGYRKDNDSLTIRNPYTSNNPYNKGQYETYNKNGNMSRLPKLDNTLANNGSLTLNNNNNNLYPNSPSSHEQMLTDKRRKVPSYDINIHNSQLLNKMMDNSQPSTGTNNNSSINLINQNQNIANVLKPYQNTLSPIKKYGNHHNINNNPNKFTPDKNNLNNTNSFNQNSPSQFKEDQNVTPNQLMRYAMKTKAGCTIQKVTKTNQDSAIVNPKILSDINIYQFAVGDGHGLNGHFVSQLIKRNLPKNFHKFFKQDDYSPENFKNAISRGFYTTNHEIFASDFDCNLSGSTLISVFIHENKLYCGNVGDSRAVIGKQKQNTAGFKAVPLSTDHKPSLERERLRIINSGGRVDCQRDFTGQPLGPLRVWLKSMDIPGLAMTRSMGDKVGVQAGVIAEPEIEEYEITEEDKFMIVASDGVWEYLTDQEVVKFVGQFYERGMLEQAAEKLITESTNAWRRESLVRDDITCIVVFFNHSKTNKNQS